MRKLSALKKRIRKYFNFPLYKQKIMPTAAMSGIVVKQLRLLLHYVAAGNAGMFFLAIFLVRQPGFAIFHIAAAVLFVIFARYIDAWNFYVFYWLTYVVIFAHASMLYAFFGYTCSVELFLLLMIPVASYALLLPSRGGKSNWRRNIFLLAATILCGLAFIYFALLPHIYVVSTTMSFTVFVVFKVYYIVMVFGVSSLETYYFTMQMVNTLQNAEETKSQLSARANFDALTGLYNRYEINRFLSDAFAAYVRRGAPLSVCMGDIDHFKNINDTYGHSAGDFVLKGVAQIMNSNIRRYSDYLGRWGGEEFLLVMPASQFVCFKRAELLRQLIENNVFEFEGNLISVTITFGIAAAGENTPTPEALVDLADKMLYEGKRAGRNCSRCIQ